MEVILSQSVSIPLHLSDVQYRLKSTFRALRKASLKEQSSSIRVKLSPSLQRFFDIAIDKDASTWQYYLSKLMVLTYIKGHSGMAFAFVMVGIPTYYHPSVPVVSRLPLTTLCPVHMEDSQYFAIMNFVTSLQSSWKRSVTTSLLNRNSNL